MAYRRRFSRYRRSYRRRRFGRGYRRVPRFRRSRRRLPRRLFGQQRRKLVRLRYYAEENLTAASQQTPVVLWWRANGPYDPDVRLGGSQPTGFARWAQLYDRYRVLKCNVVLTHISMGNQAPMTFGIAADTDSSRIYTGVRNFAENNSCRWRTTTDALSSNAMRTVKYSFKPFKFLALKYTDDAYSGSVTGTPFEEAFIATFAQNDSAISEPQNFSHKVCIDYWVEFFQPRDISAG